jgi:hypothetical protein
MPLSTHKNIGAELKAYDANASASSGAPVLILAGGTGDGVKIDGVKIDRYNGTALANSAHLVTGFLAALADTKTISFAHELQESSDGTTWDTAEAIEASTVYATSSGGTNERGVAQFDIDLSNRKRYIRFNVTPDLSNTATDTATFHTVADLGGWDVKPQ